MTISAKCPNGHVLKVKDELAGKSGFCPYCGNRVFVPMPVHTTETAKISDDEILGVLGPPSKLEVAPPPPSPPPPPDSASDSIHDIPKRPWETDLSGSSMLRKQKVCPSCGNLVSIAFTHCPRCATPLTKR